MNHDHHDFLVPRAGATVRDPQTGRALDAEGEWKPKTQFWFRRVRDGEARVGRPRKDIPLDPPSQAKGEKKGEAK